MGRKKVVILATEGLTTNLLYNELCASFDVVRVIIENKISKKVMLKNRVKRLGVFKVIGQAMFMLLIVPVLSWRSKGRLKEILTINNVNAERIPESLITRVKSVNNKDIIDLVNTSNPDIIFVNGTRIISKSVIESIGIKMVNIHVGITPKYRGVHGGYWAAYNNDMDLFGVTLHYIDSGVDTGRVIGQKVIEISKRDNFITYPIKQYVIGLDLIKGNVKNINEGVTLCSLTKESKLHYHPTIWQYICKRLYNNVK